MPKKPPEPFPKAFVVGAAAMIVFALLVAGAASFTGIGVVRAALPTAVAESRDVVFSDRADGAVVVSDFGLADSRPDILMPGAHGFVRVAVSGLAFTRHTRGVGRDAPFTLMRAADDRMWLYDPQTGAKVDLNAFGPQNRAVWVALLPSARNARLAQTGKVAP
jgi:putative photosynthetic complex assembly protein